MTLKEKFKERLYNQSHDDSECLRIRFENIDKVIDSQEVIAEEFAIGFAEWKDEKCFSVMGSESLFYVRDCEIHDDAYTNNELLEIYKKEKQL